MTHIPTPNPHATRRDVVISSQNTPGCGTQVPTTHTRRDLASDTSVHAASTAFTDAVAERAAEIVLARLTDGLPTASPYLNVDEAADYLRCSRQRIYDLLSAGRVRRFKDGSRVLVLRAELDDLVASVLPPAPHSPMERAVA